MRALIPVACVAAFGLFARFALPDILKDMAFSYQNPNFGPAPAFPQAKAPPAPPAAEEPAAEPAFVMDPRTGTLIPQAPAAKKARPATVVHPAERMMQAP